MRQKREKATEKGKRIGASPKSLGEGDKMTCLQKKILERLSYLYTSDAAQESVSDLVECVAEYGDLKGLNRYTLENPGIPWIQLEHHIYLYLLPVIIITDEKRPDFSEEYAFEERMKKKLSRFITDEDTEYDVWSRCIMRCMQLRVTAQMEQYVDAHPTASMQELSEEAARICTAASNAIIQSCSQSTRKENERGMICKIKECEIVEVYVGESRFAREEAEKNLSDLIDFVSSGVFNAVIFTFTNGDVFQFVGKNNLFRLEGIKMIGKTPNVSLLKMNERKNLTGKFKALYCGKLEADDEATMIVRETLFNALKYAFHHHGKTEWQQLIFDICQNFDLYKQSCFISEKYGFVTIGCHEQ